MENSFQNKPEPLPATKFQLPGPKGPGGFFVLKSLLTGCSVAPYEKRSNVSGCLSCSVLAAMPAFIRITFDPAMMRGKPCIRGLRVTVGMIVGLVASGQTQEEILRLYPYLTIEDIRETLSYAASRNTELLK